MRRWWRDLLFVDRLGIGVAAFTALAIIALAIGLTVNGAPP